MPIGNWGETITFEVTSEKTLTFRTMNRQVSGRWNDHPILDGKPLSEFCGAELSSVALNCMFSVILGNDPRDIIETLESASESGTVDYLYIGGKKVGEGKMRLSSVSESWDKVNAGGGLLQVSVDLTFTEYIESTDIASKDLAGTVVPWEYMVGDKVWFIGGKVYNKATKKGKGKNRKAQYVKITQYQQKKKHPWKIKQNKQDKKSKTAKKKKWGGWVDNGMFTITE